MTAGSAESAMTPYQGEPGTVSHPPVPQFIVGFEGMGTEAFGPKEQAILNRPVHDDEVEIKPDGIVFLPGVRFRQRLNDAFGPGAWGVAPREPARIMGTTIIYPGVLIVRGRVVAEAVGECQYHENNRAMSQASSREGAKTDALGRACKDIMPGILCMWDPGWLESWRKRCAEQYWGEKWDWKKKEMVKSKLWRRKDWEHRLPPDPADLMAGAGSVAPAATTDSTLKETLQASVATAATPPAAAEGGTAANDVSASSSASGSEILRAPGDDGTPATAEQKDAIKAHMRKKGWKMQFVRIWFAELFGIPVNTKDPWDVLSHMQADAAHFLVMAHGTANYRKIRMEYADQGLVRRDENDLQW